MATISSSVLAKKRTRGWSWEPPRASLGQQVEIKTIAVIGAGTMGRGFAYAALYGGYDTVLEDLSLKSLKEGMAWIKRSFDQDVLRGRVDAARRVTALSLIATASTIEDAIRDADLIIETVPEEMEMKIELFTIFDKFAKPGAIFASNTSSLSISDMADVTVSGDRCIGMHFFNPGSKMKRIKLVTTPLTSEETIASCCEVARRMGREIIQVSESPGVHGRVFIDDNSAKRRATAKP